jgi:diaminopimelate epimerase
MPQLTLTKHHGLGNDFLVILDAEGDQPLSADLARRLCDRRTGVGADGLLRATRGDTTDLVMELRNADGSPAEMSGNGARCLVQAAVDAGWVAEGDLTVLTGSGVRRVVAGPEDGPGLRTISVDMGPATVDGDLISMGNPHQVVMVDDLGAVASAADPGQPDRNVEVIARGPEPDAITMRVWERGVGETQACGTGACAAAVAAHRAGWVGPIVTVHQPGGAALVEVKDSTIVLTGPTQLVARITVEGVSP